MCLHYNFYAGKDGRYMYTKDLLELDYISRKQQSCVVDPRIVEVHTPLHLASWWTRLRYHPHRDFSHCILRGIEFRFYIGVDPSVLLTPARSNMQSATQHPEIINDYLQNELLLNRMLGPFSPHLAPSVHINCFGCIPRGRKVAFDYRLILSRG